MGSVVAEPTRWLLASSDVTVVDAFFQTNVPNVSRRIPSVPQLVYRAYLSVRGELATLGARALTGRVGLGYTLLSPLHLNDEIRGPTNNVLNVGGGLRYGVLEIELDVYNVLDLRYADDANYEQQRASWATHYVAAPPLTVLTTVAAHL